MYTFINTYDIALTHLRSSQTHEHLSYLGDHSCTCISYDYEVKLTLSNIFIDKCYVIFSYFFYCRVMKMGRSWSFLRPDPGIRTTGVGVT